MIQLSYSIYAAYRIYDQSLNRVESWQIILLLIEIKKNYICQLVNMQKKTKNPNTLLAT